MTPSDVPQGTRDRPDLGARARGTLAALRIYLGLIFLIAVVPKFSGDFAPRLSGFLSSVSLTQTHPFYRAFLTTTVMPHLRVFAWLVKGGELLVAVSLIAGLATRLGALVALALTLNYMFAKGAWFWFPSSNDGAFAVLALALIIARAGRTCGLDSYLARRWPRGPLW